MHQHEPWTPDEDDLLRRTTTLSAGDVSRLTGRSIQAVYKRRDRLMLTSSRSRPRVVVQVTRLSPLLNRARERV